MVSNEFDDGNPEEMVDSDDDLDGNLNGHSENEDDDNEDDLDQNSNGLADDDDDIEDNILKLNQGQQRVSSDPEDNDDQLRHADIDNGVDEDDEVDEEQNEPLNVESAFDERIEDHDDGDVDDDDDSEVEGNGNPQGRIQQESDNNESDERDEESEEEKGSQRDPVFILGGRIETPAYCILEGFFMESDQQISEDIANCKENPAQDWKRETLFIRHLPATLGRSHETKDPSFVGIGTEKKFSRQHLRIEYRTTPLYPYGQLQSSISNYRNRDEDDDINTTSQDTEADNKQPKLTYVDRVKYGDKSDKEVDSASPEKVVTYTNGNIPPSTGFFTLTTLGKNCIMVNGEKVEPGHTAYLYPGSIIKLSTCWFYFLTPKKHSKSEISIPFMSNYYENVLDSKTKSENDDEYVSPMRPTSSLAPFQIPPPPPQTEQYVTAQGKRAQSLQNEIDSIPTDELLSQMSNAIRDDEWDRKHQLIGSTLSYRAVMETALDATAQKLAGENEGELSRGEIMDLIATNPRWKVWVEQMLSKMEQKSYQASITKGLIKAQFTRTATTGRYIKWLLPDVGTIIKKSGKSNSSSNSKTSNSMRTNSMPNVKTEEVDNNDENDDESKKKKRKVDSASYHINIDPSKKKSRTIDDQNIDKEDDEEDDASLKMRPVKLDGSILSEQEDEEEEGDDDAEEEDEVEGRDCLLHNDPAREYDSEDDANETSQSYYKYSLLST